MKRKPQGVIVGQKDVEQSIEESIQPRARDERLHAGLTGVLNYLASGSYRIAPWWSPQRDLDLEKFWRDSDHLSGSLGLLISKVVTIPVRVMPRDTRMKKNVTDAARFNTILSEESDFGKGLVFTLSKWLLDYWGCDNGAFFEVTGPGDILGPIEGEPTGIAHLDSRRIQRTGNQEFPALYHKPNGEWVKLHRTRVIMTSDMPSAREEMYGVGFCAMSRAIHNGQMLIDLATYKEEKLGSRPKRGIVVGKGIGTDHILDAMAIADEAMDSRNLSIYSQLAVLGDLPTDAALELLDLIGLPDGFDEETSIRLGMFAIATAFGVPIRWIWPATVSGATKADAMYQHIAGLGGGIGKILTTLTFLLGGDPNSPEHGVGKFLPPHLKLVFDFQDDEQDENRANIQTKRATVLKTNLETGVYDMRTAREQALTAGDLSQSQFDRLELADGRLPDGTDVIGLFHVTNEPFLSWLDLGVESPLSVSENDPLTMLSEIDRAAVTIQDAIANSSSTTTKEKAEQASAALNKLKALYAPLASQSVQNELMEQFGVTQAQPQEALPEKDTEVEGVAEQQTPTEAAQETKSFDYGVSAGNIIGGQLARGIGGRFVSAAELRAQVQAGMLSRMGVSNLPSKNSASSKRGANRAKVSDLLGIDTDILAAMMSGDASYADEKSMVALGLAEVNDDGSISMTPSGRKVLSAANSGDVDEAESALAKAKKKPEEKKPKAGAGPKPTAEERQQEREAAEAKEKAENRQKVAEQLTGRMDQANFDALMKFSEGSEPSYEEAQALAQAGMVELDDKGNPRMTGAGQAFVNAANRGDIRKAKDVLSRAEENVTNTLQKAEDQDEAAVQYEENAAKAIEDGDTRAAQYTAAADQIIASIASATAPYSAQVDRLNKLADEQDTKATGLESNAAEYESKAATLRASVALMPEEKRRITEEQAKYFEDKAKQAKTEAADIRKASAELRTQGLATSEAATKLSADMQDKAKEYQKAADEAKARAVEVSDEWKRRAEDLRKQAEEWRRSVGNATLPEVKGLKKFFIKARRKYNPIPTEKEVDRAIAEWDKRMPEYARGLLKAKREE